MINYVFISFSAVQIYNLSYIHLNVPSLRNRKQFPCSYRVLETRVKVWNNEKCYVNANRRRVFPQFFPVLPSFHVCFYNSIETRRKFVCVCILIYIFLFQTLANTAKKRKESCLFRFIKM